jgi:hypothetical protein
MKYYLEAGYKGDKITCLKIFMTKNRVSNGIQPNSINMPVGRKITCPQFYSYP